MLYAVLDADREGLEEEDEPPKSHIIRRYAVGVRAHEDERVTEVEFFCSVDRHREDDLEVFCESVLSGVCKKCLRVYLGTGRGET